MGKIMAVFSEKVEYWDIEESEGSGTTIRAKNGEVTEAKDGLYSIARIRAFHRGAWAYSTSKLSEREEKASLERACESAIRLSKIVKKRHSLGGFFPANASYKTKSKMNPADFSISEKLGKLKEILSGAKGVNTESGYSDSFGTIRLFTSEGLYASQELSSCGISLMCIAREGDNIQRSFQSKRKTGGYEVVDRLGASFGENCSRRAKALLSAKSPPAGKMTVIMDPRLVGTFVHEAVGHMAEADHIANGDSVLKGRLGEKIGSNLVTIVDDKTAPGGYGTRGFDRDGAKSERTAIIEKGVLSRYLQSRNSAGKVGGLSTGNSWSAFNNVRMSNTFALPGKNDFSEIVRETKEGVYLLGSMGGTAQTSDGTFNFSAMEGFLVKNGRLGERIRDVTLLGKTLETLESVDYVSKGFALEAGQCGKGGEWVPVGSGGPHFRARAVVGGKGG